MEIVTYINRLKEWVKPYLLEKEQVQSTTERCCISITPKEVSLLHVDYNAEGMQLIQAERLAYDDFTDLSLLLPALMTRYALALVPTFWLLQPDEYQLFLIDSLPVSEEEITDALTWRIQSLINYPTNEAVIDYFMLPAKKGASSRPMVASVVAKESTLLKVVNIFKNNQLQLSTIDIPELALRNLSSLYETDEKSTAIIYFYHRMAILNISHQKTLYFTRQLPIPMTTDNNTIYYEEFCLEITRYFDYFQNQWRFPVPSRVFVIAKENEITDIASQLSTHLLLPVEPFTLTAVNVNNKKKTEIEANYLLPWGCLMREERNDAATRN
ncbi:MAG TPA: hypothetical protein VNC84_05945 [Gammaproteobacteria bacterium]|nr:hypothetical protein [Gammaproteobacteria bacterium]